MMNLFKLTAISAAFVMSTQTYAESLAITNATVYTAAQQGVLKDATVVIENGNIVAVNPSEVSADTIIDAEDKILTPGFIGSLNGLGLVEVSAVADSRDGGDKKATMTFDPSLAFNPRSSLIPYARKGGITSNVIAPYGGDDIFAGLASLVSLSGEFDSVTRQGVALYVKLGAKHEGSRALSLQTLIDTLEKHSERDEDDDKSKGKEAEILDAVFAKEIPLVIDVSRASDMLELLKVKARFDVDMVFAGAQDAVLITEQLADSDTPVVISAMDNLPGSFDSMHAHLENAAKLEQAGVTVILTIAGDSAHNLYQLRFDAGNAVSYGMTAQGALAAITSNVASAFNLDVGQIAPGKPADLVLWSADPFEFSTRIEKVWINGTEVSTQSRHDKLRERYTTDSEMPRAYSK
ncbi:amidohydrolase family protein [Pseudoalteromonas sp. Cnat2-41]|uniref:amidohydrolase family protein n=1 Tax=unclassified Pseudoalteromonas TaxID=194690 RepID=UPI001EF98CCF|nr:MULTISPECIES: amidohydrolase family protein [unclassified Pseudoalteromonas]MCF2861754.1 amidohydrolase family protein [Pseudoalteromonas sp. CNAT2-18]MCG7557207.1 amidohydrolase family protein [Pseudoalteromonas sp. CNAT2-18.1]